MSGLAVFRRNQFVPPDFLSGKQAIALQGWNVGEEIAAEDGIEVVCFGKALLLPIVCFPMQEAGTEQVGNRLGRGSLLSGDQVEAEVERTQIFGHLNGVFEDDGCPSRVSMVVMGCQLKNLYCLSAAAFSSAVQRI